MAESSYSMSVAGITRLRYGHQRLLNRMGNSRNAALVVDQQFPGKRWLTSRQCLLFTTNRKQYIRKSF